MRSASVSSDRMLAKLRVLIPVGVVRVLLPVSLVSRTPHDFGPLPVHGIALPHHHVTAGLHSLNVAAQHF